jgi:hypothetical protein
MLSTDVEVDVILQLTVSWPSYITIIIIIIIIIIITFSFYRSNHHPIGLDIKYVTCKSSLYVTRHKIKHIYIYI